MSILLNPYRLAVGGAASFDGTITTGVFSTTWQTAEGGEGMPVYFVDHYEITKGYSEAGMGDWGALGSISSNTFAGKTIKACYVDDYDGSVTFMLMLGLSGSPLGAGAISTVNVNGVLLTGLSYYNTGIVEQWYKTGPPTIFGSLGDIVPLVING